MKLKKCICVKSGNIVRVYKYRRIIQLESVDRMLFEFLPITEDIHGYVAMEPHTPITEYEKQKRKYK